MFTIRITVNGLIPANLAKLGIRRWFPDEDEQKDLRMVTKPAWVIFVFKYFFLTVE
ncbi:hypothetical protein KC571_02335 [candidate division WWE3 bacterium]|uniref:Uncharacterized protein n=1 Tax=candidate division WWE3 bacterium TaxID=2053526 RepID=A0A955LGW1_UNCKA|nr:hypothetical protein [candidate division WWE3 bacterium]